MSFWSRIERRIGEFAGELVPDEFRDRLARARHAIGQDDLEEARALLLDLAEQRPEHTGTNVLLGVVHLQQGNPELAKGAFDTALEHADDIPEALIGRGEAALALDEAADAVPYFRAAIDAAGGDRELLASAYRGLGIAYRRTGELDKAIRELRKAVAEASEDALAIAALGDALSADSRRSNDQARRYLERLADRDSCPTVAWLALGRIALDDDDPEKAIAYFERVAEREEDTELRVQALLGIAAAHLHLKDGALAETVLQQALLLQPRNAAALTRLGEAKCLQGELEPAMRFFERSLAIEENPSTARSALALAIEQRDIPAGVAMANRVLADDAEDPLALTARGLDLAEQGHREAARATYEQALRRGENLEALMALSRLELAAGDITRATAFANRALRTAPRDVRAKEQLAECGAANLGVQLHAESDWYDLAAAALRLCSRHPELAFLVSEAGVAMAEFDQPLLVAVMGEFSSGKSSFVNAFVGDDVAPTGITPTTATINIVKYGRERGGRVVYRDNTSRELAHDELTVSLAGIDEEEARKVRHVELLMPIEVLERVNIIDTPGLNSILPEHEAVAREFLQRADAVVWLFTVNQAGKSTEKRALDSIRDEGVRVLGVLNKIDQLAPAQVEEIISYVRTELGERVETCIPISARRALLGENDSGWDELRNELEARFFKHARLLKKQALNRRLENVLDKADACASKGSHSKSEHAAALRDAADQARRTMLHFVDEVVENERLTIGHDAGLLYREAAREVLELVRPRKLPFGSHKASPADRDYLLGLLESGFERLLSSSRERCAMALQTSANALLEANREAIAGNWRELSELVGEGMLLVQAEVFQSCLSFLRGYLRGGFVDHFFAGELPKLELKEDAIYSALFRGAPELDAEISLPLASAGGRLLGELGRRLDHLAGIADVEATEMDAGLRQALSRLSAHRAHLQSELLRESHG